MDDDFREINLYVRKRKHRTLALPTRDSGRFSFLAGVGWKAFRSNNHILLPCCALKLRKLRHSGSTVYRTNQISQSTPVSYSYSKDTEAKYSAVPSQVSADCGVGLLLLISTGKCDVHWWLRRLDRKHSETGILACLHRYRLLFMSLMYRFSLLSVC